MHWLNLLSYLLKREHRKDLQKLLERVSPEPPYDIIIKTLYTIQEDITKEEFMQIVAGKVSSECYTYLKTMPDKVSKVVALQSLREIESEDKLNKIVNILKRDEGSGDKIERIRTITESRIVAPEPQSKPITAFEEDDVLNIMDIFGYDCSKEELLVLCAYSGRGKTTLLLSIIKQACEAEYKCLYIAIADWSESMLKHKIGQARDFPNFYAVCYSECDVHRIESEIEAVRPDIVCVDYLTVINPDNIFEAYRHQLMHNAKMLKQIAQRQNVLMLTAHQANTDAEIIESEHLAEAKQGIISQSDLVLGFGKHGVYDNQLTVNTIKSRRHKMQPLKNIIVDFTNFVLEEV